VLLIYSSDGSNVYGESLRAQGWYRGRGAKVVKIVFLGGQFLITCSDTFTVRCII